MLTYVVYVCMYVNTPPSRRVGQGAFPKCVHPHQEWARLGLAAASVILCFLLLHPVPSVYYSFLSSSLKHFVKKVVCTTRGRLTKLPYRPATTTVPYFTAGVSCSVVVAREVVVLKRFHLISCFHKCFIHSAGKKCSSITAGLPAPQCDICSPCGPLPAL